MMRPLRGTRFGLGLGTLAVLAFALSAADLQAGGSKDDKKKDDKRGPHLRYATSYAEAWAEAKARNTLIYATVHKDH